MHNTNSNTNYSYKCSVTSQADYMTLKRSADDRSSWQKSLS